MKKYRIVSKKNKHFVKNINLWEIELRRSYWREKHQERMSRKYIVYFGDDIDLLPTEPNAADEYLSRFYINLLPNALAMLSENERQIIFDYYYERLSDQKIGQRMGITSQSVCERRHRILCKMLKFLEAQK